MYPTVSQKNIQRIHQQIQFRNKLNEVAPQSFYVGISFLVASFICFLVAVFTKTSVKDRKIKKAAQQKKIILYVFGSIFALIGLFLWTPFLAHVSYR